MPPTTSSQVAIFWDYENCRLSNDTDGNKVIDGIQCIVQSFGSITTFRAYLDLSLDCAYSRSITLHSDLQSSGLTLVHCPHNGKKDVADKMMIVDMLAFAIDRPAPACIVLITGDRDFAYAAAILKLRGYHVIVISPTCNTHSSLKVRAHELYDWQNDVLGGTGGSSPVINSSGHKVVGSVASASQTNGGSISEATGPIVSQGQGCIESITPIGGQAGKYHSLFLGRGIPESSPLKIGRATQTLASVCDSRSVSVATLDVNLDAAARAVQEDSTLDYPTGSLCGNRVTALSADEQSTLVGMTAEDTQSMRTTEDSQSSAGPKVIACPSPVKPIGLKISYIGQGATSRPSTTDTSTPSSDSSLVSEPIGSSFFDDLSSSSGYGISNTLNPVLGQFGMDAVERATRLDEYTPFFAGVNEAEGQKATIPSFNSTDTVNSITVEASQTHSDSFPESTESSNTVPLNPLTTSFQPTFRTEQRTTSETPTTPVAHSTHIPTETDRRRFQTLILFFIERRASSQPVRILSSEVATTILKRDPQVYQKAGVTKLKVYIEEARKAGVIISPGLDKQGNTWVEINPSLYPSTTVAKNDSPPDPPTPAKPYNPPPTPSPKSPPSKPQWIYAPLTNRLRQESPSHRVLYSALGMFFRKEHADLYERAGVSGLSAYLERAEKLGIIRIGKEGSPGSEWAELMPAYRGTVFGGNG